MKLREVSPNDEYSSVAVKAFEETAPITQDLELYTRTGSADSVKDAKQGVEKTKITRSLNEENSENPRSRSYSPVQKKLVSYTSLVDVALEDRNEDIASELIQELESDSKEAGYKFQDMLFNGDNGSDPEDFDGMLNIVPDTQIRTPETNGIVMPMGNSDENFTAQQNAIEHLINGFASIQGGATHAYVNEYLRTRILLVAKNVGFYSKSKDELGNIIEKIGKTIIRGAGYDRNGNPLLPFTEVCGSRSNTSPIIAVRWGERLDLTMLTSVGLKARYTGQHGNFYKINVNMDAALHLQNIKAITKIKGWARTF